MPGKPQAPATSRAASAGGRLAACLSPARGRCPSRDTAPRAGPSPQLRRSRVRITLRSGSRRGAILSPAAAARPQPPPGRGLPAPAGLTRPRGAEPRLQGRCPSRRPPSPAQHDRRRQTDTGGASPGGRGRRQPGFQRGFVPGPGHSGAAERSPPLHLPVEKGRRAPARGSRRRRAPGAGGRPGRAAVGLDRLPCGPHRRSHSPALREAARSQRDPGYRTKRQHGGDRRGGQGEKRGSRAQKGSRQGARPAGRGAGGSGPGRGARAALTGIWLLIEDCSLIIQPGCGRHRRGQEDQNQEDAEALEAAELPEGVRRRSGTGPYSCSGGRLCRLARSGRCCTRGDTRRRLPHKRPGPAPRSRTSATSVAPAQLEAPPARPGRELGRRGGAAQAGRQAGWAEAGGSREAEAAGENRLVNEAGGGGAGEGRGAAGAERDERAGAGIVSRGRAGAALRGSPTPARAGGFAGKRVARPAAPPGRRVLDCSPRPRCGVAGWRPAAARRLWPVLRRAAGCLREGRPTGQGGRRQRGWTRGGALRPLRRWRNRRAVERPRPCTRSNPQSPSLSGCKTSFASLMLIGSS